MYSTQKIIITEHIKNYKKLINNIHYTENLITEHRKITKY